MQHRFGITRKSGLRNVMWLAVVFLTIGDAHALVQPTDIICGTVDNVIDKVKVTWKDQSSDETAYRVERRVDTGGWSTLVDLAADSKEYIDTGLNTSSTYRYRVAPLDGSTVGPYSSICRKSMHFDSINDEFRMFYRPYSVADAPPVSGRQMLVPMTTNAAGDNEYAARISGILEDSREGLLDVGFDDVAFFDNGRLLPVDLLWCDGGGCAGTDSFGNGRKGGIGLAPQFMGPYDPLTGVGDPSSVLITLHEVFHQQQYTYGGLGTDPQANWVWEGQARSIQDKVCLEEDGAGNCSFSLDSVVGGIANYVGEVNGYLANPSRPITQISYGSALFWTYVTEQYGTLAREPDIGMDLLVDFWEQARADRNDDGIGTLNRALAALGHSARFRDTFMDFAVANYAKDLTGSSVPAEYQYADEMQSPGAYRSVRLDIDETLGTGDQVGPTTDDVREWSVRYYQVQPDPTVPIINVEFRQDTSNNVYYTLLAIKNNDIALEINHTGRDFLRTFANDAYDKVVVIVAALENFANFRYAFNAIQPVLNIVDPLQARPAQAGDPAVPEKILVKVEVLSSLGGMPVAGIDPNDITITIGPQVVQSSQRISSAEVQGQYWLLILAPTQTSAGTYDLTVDYVMLTDTKTAAVLYAVRADADNVLLIDRSGSMNNPSSKIFDAKSAARLYVDSWRDGDKIGVVSYANSATVDLSLQDWDDIPNGSRDQAIAAINGLTAIGATSIGEALETGQGELIRDGDNAHEWALVLLSDGLNTVGKTAEEYLNQDYRPRRDAGEKVPRIHTVALGPDADRTTMERIAQTTGGTYHYAAEPPTSLTMMRTLATQTLSTPDFVWRELAEIYRVIGETVALQQQILSVREEIPREIPPASNIHEFRVDGSTTELIVTLKWEPSSSLGAEVTLTTPDNLSLSLVDATLRDLQHVVWRIPTPVSGKWTLTVTGEAGLEFVTRSYLAEAAVKSDLTIDAFLGLAVEERLIGRPMPILASLSDTLPIMGATVNVQITNPAGAVLSIALFDDGRHGDGAAGDGFYGNIYYQTSVGGSYVAVITAEGTSNLGEAFQRRLRLSFNLDDRPQTVPDSDGDRMPDWWEIEWGTDPNLGDAEQDPDGDGVPNAEEFEDGTNPLDPDTDNGGENDGSESDMGSDPHDPSDDGIAQPRAFAWPGIERIWVLHTVQPNYDQMEFYRSLGLNEPFNLVAAGVSPTERWIDEDVTNDTEYCYRVVAVDAGNKKSAPSTPICTTPKADPIPPTCGILINGGELTTDSRNVELTLFANDNPTEDEHEVILDDGFRFPPRDREDAEASGVADMMISNDGAFSDASWEPFVPTKDWELMNINEGLATVYVKYRDRAGNVSDMCHATISVLADSGIVSAFEGPGAGPVSGIGIINGWAFAPEPNVQIERVELFIDGLFFGEIPCCSERGDVQAAFPDFPEANTLHSGWGITFNWGTLSAGQHTVRVITRNTIDQVVSSAERIVTVVKPGDFEFVDRFDLSGAVASLDGEELTVEGVVVREKATQQEKEINARFRWFTTSQSLGMVQAETVLEFSSLLSTVYRLFASLSAQLRDLVETGSATAAPGIRGFFDNPGQNQPVSGIGLVQGWAFAEESGATITEVRQATDGQPGVNIPCCSVRSDVAAAFPDNPNAVNSGWGATFNYGLLASGRHRMSVQIADSIGDSLTFDHDVTVTSLGGFEFLDLFDVSGATARIEGEEILIEGVIIRDQISQQTKIIDVRLRWFVSSQSLVIVSSIE